jgi:hypothetical protein
MLTSRPKPSIKGALSDLPQFPEDAVIDLAARTCFEQINKDISVFLDDKLRKKNINGPRKTLIMENIISKADGMYVFFNDQSGAVR